MTDIKSRLRPEEFATYIQLLIFAKPYWDSDAGFAELQQGRAGAATDLMPQPVHGFEGQAAACINHDTPNQLQSIGCPCLVIGGRSDIFTPVWMAEEVAARIPHCDLHLYEGAGHAFHWERIEDFNPRVRAWLRAH
jgi:pimeloyl-ACP methyl ester carboxylesterase